MTLWLKSRKSRAAPEIRESFWPKAPPFVPFVELVMYVRGLESQSLHILQGKVMRRLLYESKPQGQTTWFTWFPNQSPFVINITQIYEYIDTMESLLNPHDTPLSPYENTVTFKSHWNLVKFQWNLIKSPLNPIKHHYIRFNLVKPSDSPMTTYCELSDWSSSALRRQRQSSRTSRWRTSRRCAWW